jgi:hypothetical protein
MATNNCPVHAPRSRARGDPRPRDRVRRRRRRRLRGHVRTPPPVDRDPTAGHRHIAPATDLGLLASRPRRQQRTTERRPEPERHQRRDVRPRPPTPTPGPADVHRRGRQHGITDRTDTDAVKFDLEPDTSRRHRRDDRRPAAARARVGRRRSMARPAGSRRSRTRPTRRSSTRASRSSRPTRRSFDGNHVLHIVDISAPVPPPNLNYDAPRYRNPSWTQAEPRADLRAHARLRAATSTSRRRPSTGQPDPGDDQADRRHDRRHHRLRDPAQQRPRVRQPQLRLRQPDDLRQQPRGRPHLPARHDRARSSAPTATPQGRDDGPRRRSGRAERPVHAARRPRVGRPVARRAPLLQRLERGHRPTRPRQRGLVGRLRRRGRRADPATAKLEFVAPLYLGGVTRTRCPTSASRRPAGC